MAEITIFIAKIDITAIFILNFCHFYSRLLYVNDNLFRQKK